MRKSVFAAQALSLALTGWLVWRASLMPRFAREPVRAVVAEAFEYALIAWAWSAAITFTLYLVVGRRAREEALALTLRTSATGVWFAPATILLSSFSPGALAASLVLVVSATRLLYAEWTVVCGPKPARSRRLELAPALAVSFMLQAAVLAAMMGYPLLASAFAAMGAALLTLLSMTAGAWEPVAMPSLPRSIFGAVLTVVLAAGLTVAGVRIVGSPAPDFSLHARPGAVDAFRALLREIFYGEAPGQEAARFEKALPGFDSAFGLEDVEDDSFPGVILWPEAKPRTALVDPLPAAAGGWGALSPTDPYGIPFAGEYWMFKPPHSRPPLNSYLRRGDPVKLGFKSVDRRPLFMQARHRLERPMDARCCSSVVLEVANGDAYAWSVSLELVLVDSRTPAVQSLGRLPLSTRPAVGREQLAPVREALVYPAPATAAIREFDELRVVFHRDRVRSYRSARVAVERFVFMPRGRP